MPGPRIVPFCHSEWGAVSDLGGSFAERGFKIGHRVVEQLLQFLVGVVDAQLLEAVQLEDLEASDVEDTDEAGSLSLGSVQ